MGDRLLFFMGTECSKCHEMEPDVEKLQKELSVSVTALEVYHDAANNKLLMDITEQGAKCSQLPFFYNEKTGEMICGKCDYDRLKEWASATK